MDIHAITTQQILERISRHCPEAMTVYMHVLNRADSNGECHFTKEMIDIEMSEEFRVFRSGLKKLAREEILEWSPTKTGINVILARYE